MQKIINGEVVDLTPEEEAAVLAERAARQAARMARSRADMAARIDAAVEAIYERPMRLAKEYEQREAAAQAFKDAGYTGTAPMRVRAFADAAGLAYPDAATLILQQSAQLRGALDSLSDLRMAKYQLTRKNAQGQFALGDTDAQAALGQTLAQIQAIGAAIA